MLGWHVDHDQAVNAGFLGLRDEARNAVMVDRVEVTHQHQWRVVVAFTELADHLQGFRQVLLGAQGADVGELDRRAIGHRIGEGHAQLDHVGTGLWQPLEDRQ
ncbi:hypothetical protein D3C72_1983990 [compost metagenome]